MAKRRGRLLQELSLVERVPIGYSGLRRHRLITPESPITVHRRTIKGMTNYAGDPREAYATPQDEMPSKGTLPERCLFKALTDAHMVHGSDFTFQSGTLGGRVELGGMVADFLIYRPPIVIRIQGINWHGQFDRETGNIMPGLGDIVQGRRDDEQGQILSSMGYAVLDLFEDAADDHVLLEMWLQRYLYPMMAGILA